jgi:hypothetical protein
VQCTGTVLRQGPPQRRCGPHVPLKEFWPRCKGMHACRCSKEGRKRRANREKERRKHAPKQSAKGGSYLGGDGWIVSNAAKKKENRRKGKGIQACNQPIEMPCKQIRSILSSLHTPLTLACTTSIRYNGVGSTHGRLIIQSRGDASQLPFLLYMYIYLHACVSIALLHALRNPKHVDQPSVEW